ncbi:zf-CCHC domain-containing protein [Tanacetum coccineum]
MAVRDFKKLFRRRGKFVRQPHDDKKNFRKIKEDKNEKEDRRCFKCGDLNHFISDCPKHSYNDQKAFVVRCWSDSEEDSKKDEICLVALNNNEVFSDTPYYSSSSLDSESLQNKYNKIEQLERSKEACLKCESCDILQSKVSSLSLKLASFKSSSLFLQEMLEKQKTQKDKHGIGFTEYIASTSKTKMEKFGPVDEKTPTIELAVPAPSAREPAISNEGNRPSVEESKILESNVLKRNSSVQITRKPSSNNPVRNVEQTSILKLSQVSWKK